MRSRLTARSARLFLAAAAVTALAATTTACGPEDNGAAATATSSSTESADNGGNGGNGGSATTDGSSAGDSGSGSDSGSGDAKNSGSSGSSDKTGSGDGGKSGYGQSCGTNDLDFTVTTKSQAGGYYLVTAKAKSGITCYLDVNTPSVSFGSDADGVASPVGQGGEDPIKLTGSTAAYTGISPKTTNSDSGVEFENVIIGLTEEDPNPAELKLPEPATVDKPIVTGWATNPANSVPVIV
ncbi:hypothetical protein ACIQAD_23045 [Streptomyces sp. NPDC088551]|uniref:hypothetical protein n=1 Tax=unclassified Streptomyces TaxID=2593676 RepID=UPI0038181831